MSQIISFFSNVIKNIFNFHKKKIFLVFISAIVFFVLFFPYNNLSGWLSSEISRATRGQLNLSLGQMDLKLWPTGLLLQRVSVNTAFAPSFQVKEIILSPSLSLYGGASVAADGFFKGQVNISYENGKKIPGNSGKRWRNINGNLKNISISEILRILESSIPVTANLSSQFQIGMDPTFRSNIKGEILMLIKNLKLSASNLPTPMGALLVPSLFWKKAQLKAKMIKDELVVSEFTFGEPTSVLSGRAKGKIVFKLSSRRKRVQSEWGAYNFRLELNVKKPISKELSSFLILLDQFKKESSAQTTYLLELKGSGSGNVPEMSAISGL